MTMENSYRYSQNVQSVFTSLYRSTSLTSEGLDTSNQMHLRKHYHTTINISFAWQKLLICNQRIEVFSCVLQHFMELRTVLIEKLPISITMSVQCLHIPDPNVYFYMFTSAVFITLALFGMLMFNNKIKNQQTCQMMIIKLNTILKLWSK